MKPPHKPFRLLIDGREANTKNRVGSNVYAFEIITALERLTRRLGGKWQVTIALTEPAISDLPRERAGWEYRLIGPSKFFTQWALPLHLYKYRDRYDLTFSPSHYGPRLSPHPSVITIFDLAFLKFPDQFRYQDRLQLKHWTAYSVRQAAKVITISKFSATQIKKHFKLPQSKIVVAPPAVAFKSDKKALVNLPTKEPFLLYLGTIQPRKNIDQIIEGFNQFKRQMANQSLKLSASRYKQFANLKLIIAGKIGWLATKTQDAVDSSPFREDIIMTGFVDEATKWALLSEALCTLHLGSEEGFGIPVLESLEAGTVPVVASDSSLTEAAGEAGLIVKAGSSYSLNQALRKVVSQTSRTKAIFNQKRSLQLAKFDWTKSASTILETLESAATKASLS